MRANPLRSANQSNSYGVRFSQAAKSLATEYRDVPTGRRRGPHPGWFEKPALDLELVGMLRLGAVKSGSRSRKRATSHDGGDGVYPLWRRYGGRHRTAHTNPTSLCSGRRIFRAAP
jgi:hypothetical protein